VFDGLLAWTTIAMSLSFETLQMVDKEDRFLAAEREYQQVEVSVAPLARNGGEDQDGSRWHLM
jgi:hypothetical protein